MIINRGGAMFHRECRGKLKSSTLLFEGFELISANHTPASNEYNGECVHQKGWAQGTKVEGRGNCESNHESSV
jgi:hypothetical protein